MRNARLRGWATAIGLILASGCTCADLPDAIFQCEPNGECAQPGFVCGADNMCRKMSAHGSDAGPPDSGFMDAGSSDAGSPDAGPQDAGSTDAGPQDAGSTDAGSLDAGPQDAGPTDAGSSSDAGSSDAGSSDAGSTDAGSTDAGSADAGSADAGSADAGSADAGLADAGLADAGWADAGWADAGLADAGSADAGCVITGAIDEPDPQNQDVDCDGFDGDLSRAIFVDPIGGLDTNAGTQAAPVQTLSFAVTSGKEQVYLATGTSTENVVVNDALAIFGGYNPAASWSRTSTKSLVIGTVRAQPSDAGRVVLELLEVQAPAATTPGAASVAVTFRNAASTSRIAQCRFVGGTGANGANGTPAQAVNSGNAGSDGLSGDEGGDGGSGAPGADCGDAGFSDDGFSGGGSGDDGRGFPGDDVALGGSPGAETYCDGGPCTGLFGNDGLAGTDGQQSNSRPADLPPTYLGSLIGAQWQSSRSPTWTPAQSGRPGGGGGGGGGLLDLVNSLLGRGGGAGGGGSGGCGGRSGIAGQNGGASIALILVDSSPIISEVQLVSTQAGHGGTGGNGSLGAPGGAGGTGQAGQTIASGSAGSAGYGGPGGRGGDGRQGPGGWGGPVVGLFCGGSSAPVIDSNTTWTPGAPGLPGAGDPVGRPGGQPASGFHVNCL